MSNKKIMKNSRRILVAYWGFMLSLLSTSLSAAVMVDANWLKKNINNPHVVVIDMSDSLQYRRFHIPGAINLEYDAINRRTEQGVSLKVSNQRLYAILGKRGITAKHHIIIYDDLGGFSAGRLFWQLETIGHKNVSVVNGGLVAWVLAHNKVSNKQVIRQPVVYIPDNDAAGRKNEIDTKSVGKLAAQPAQVAPFLLDVRTRNEYVGNPQVKKTGHIPGARWWPWIESLDMKNGFVLHNSKKLLKSLSEIGVTKKTDAIVLYCRSGHRASQSYLTLRSLGFSNVRLYDGSILEYSKTQNMVFRKGQKP